MIKYKTMEKLFDEKEIFIKIRPVKLPDSEKEKFYRKMAKEIIDEGWSSSDIDDIIEDLKDLRMYQTGFEMANNLNEGYHRYEINSNFIAWLEDFSWEADRALEEIVKQWVKIHNPLPQFKKGDKLIINIDLNSKQKFGDKIYITGIKTETACYYTHENADNNGGYVIPFERVESSCTLI
jgi:hypothetical protein